MLKNDKKTLPEDQTTDIARRDFLRYSAWTITSVSLTSLTYGCGGGSIAPAVAPPIQPYPIDSTVVTTAQRMLSFPMTGMLASPTTGAVLTAKDLSKVSQYSSLGYGNWTFGAALPVVQRTDIMASAYANPTPTRNKKLLNFFAMSDIHITDKEAPNQLPYLQQIEPRAYSLTSVYTPAMLYSTQVLDAAVQTMNALHQQNPFDFGISLGDATDSTRYNETRWYIDVIDGKVITPSSGAHVGADTIDYQKPFQAVGLDKSIPWYQVLGNHDHFLIGSFPVDADPSLGFRQSYVSDKVWSVADVLVPHTAKFPVLFNMADFKAQPSYYQGYIDGSTQYGQIAGAGLTTDAAFASGAPRVVADPNRRSLLRTEWIQEFFNTTTVPAGHGFNLVDSANPAWESNGFACYSFVPNPKVPLKVIVLDDTQSESDGSIDIHGHGYLDANRWAWLQAELAKGQAANQLMIIAAHIPIGVSAIGSEMEWWLGETGITSQNLNAVNLAGLVKTLQGTPNLLMWIAGHRHMNTVKAFVSADSTKPEQGFWQVETSSLRDFPQQFRTFEIYLNSDYTVSILTTNVDPAVADGTPAATSRKYAIAAQQIVKQNVNLNTPNVSTVGGVIPVPSMDPTRAQDGTVDPTVKFVDMSGSGIASNGSYNAELFKQLSPQMVGILKAMYPQPA